MDFDQIYKQYKSKVRRFISYRIQKEMIAEELTSDVMLKVYKNLHLFDESKANISTWIINITKNTMIDYYRKRKLEVISIQSFHNDDSDNVRAFEYTDSELNPEDQFIQNELSKKIYDKFDALNRDEKTIATMYYFRGLTYDEIVDQLNMPLGTVKAKLHRARKVLAHELPELKNVKLLINQ